MIRLIRGLLHDQGFTIVGARNKLQEATQAERDRRRSGEVRLDAMAVSEGGHSVFDVLLDPADFSDFSDFPDFYDSEKLATHGMINKKVEAGAGAGAEVEHLQAVRQELNQIRDLLNTGL